MLILGAMLSLFIYLPVAGTSAQVGSVASDPAPLIGSWTLNRELSGATPSPDVQGRRGEGRGGGARGGGFGGGMGGGRAGRSPSDQGRSDARAEGERAVALVQELITPTTKWLITRATGDMLAFTNADGRTARYTPNNKTEKHQLTNGTIETKSKWSRGELSQEISASDVIEIVRTFAIDSSTGQLIVTTTFTGGRQQRPFRVVYDRDDE